MKKLVIFGAGDIAQLAHFYFQHDGGREIVAFTVDDAYMDAATFCGLPVVPFSELASRYPPTDFDMFVALSYAKLNAIRCEKYLVCKALGYALASYVSSRATCFPNVSYGENCFILEDNTLQPFVKIGSNVTLWSGNHVGHHSTVGDHCFVSSHVVISGGVSIGDFCFIGVNATLRDHVTIGEKSVIGAGALILGDVEPLGVYIGSASERSRIPSNRLRNL